MYLDFWMDKNFKIKVVVEDVSVGISNYDLLKEFLVNVESYSGFVLIDEL